jgi:hypothetical protein
LEAAEWIKKEFQTVDLGDERLNQRLFKVANALYEQPERSINAAIEDWASTKAAYRFFDHPSVNSSALFEPHQKQTIKRVKSCKRVLAIQDTTYLNFSNLECIEGLGNIGKTPESVCPIQGLVMHQTLAVDPDGHPEGLPLGILSQEIWSRAGRDKKESHKWSDALIEHVGNGHELIYVTDREGQIFDFMRAVLDRDHQFLIRCKTADTLAYDAASEKYQTLQNHLREAPELGGISVEVHAQKKKMVRGGKNIRVLAQSREAKLTVQAKTLELLPRDKKKHGSFKLTAIWVREIDPPSEYDAVDWILLSSLPAEDLEQVLEKIQWYKMRWHIENFHKVLKSGCQVERSRLEHLDRLKPYLTLMSILAWRLYWMSRVGRLDDQLSCALVLSPSEWKALYLKINKKKPPQTPPTLQQAMIWIAQLGGFNARKSDGYPGAQSI